MYIFCTSLHIDGLFVDNIRAAHVYFFIHTLFSKESVVAHVLMISEKIVRKWVTYRKPQDGQDTVEGFV